jgi:hypothetical protein
MQILNKKIALIAAIASLFLACKPTKTVTIDPNSCIVEQWQLNDTHLDFVRLPKSCLKFAVRLKGQIAKIENGEFQLLDSIARITQYQTEIFYINNKPYTGLFVGVLEENGVLDTLLECQFADGLRISGSFLRTADKKVIYTEAPSSPKYLEPYDNNIQVEKPVIYLYPTTTQIVNVQVNFKGELSHTYPKYPTSAGWTVLAKPDGELLDEKMQKTYYNLFWEGESAYQYSLNTGFVVAGDETADFLDNALEKLGLNRREANEFITYWLPRMEKNAYNLIHFSDQEYKQQAALDVTPKPDTEIRVFMVYQPLKSPIIIAPQTLSPPARKGFTLVEWGGKCQPQPKF